MKVYTKTGDQGETGISSRERLKKSHARIKALGAVDELNSALGVALTHSQNKAKAILPNIQSQLFSLGAELSLAKNINITEQDVAKLEEIIDTLDEELPTLKSFILPGGHEVAAQLHLARSICRRAEICLVELHETESVSSANLQYLNRLSDLLFMLARWVNHQHDIEEITWPA